MTGYSSAVGYDLMSRGKDARVSSPGADGPREPTWMLPRNEEVVLQFLADPTTADTNYGWLFYRECRADGILLPGTWQTGDWAGTPRAELPFRVRDIPVEDIELVEVDGEQKYRYRRPYLEVTPGQLLNVVDDIIDARSQRFTNDDGRTKVDWMVMTNAIVWSWPDVVKKNGELAAKPEVGQHVVVKLWKTAAAMILERLISRIEEEGPDFDVTEWKWSVKIVGGNPNTLILKRLEKISEPLNYELYSLMGIVERKKEAFEEHVCAAFSDYAGLVPTDTEEVVDVSTETPDDDEVAADESTAWVDMLTNTAIRARLKKADIPVPSGANRKVLRDLAIEHLVS